MSTGNKSPEPADADDGDSPDIPAPTHPHLQRHHAPGGRFERSMDTVRRDARAAELRAQKLTFQQIADELGYAGRGDAYQAVKRARADVARPAVTKLIQSESEELDDLYAMALEVIDANHVVVSHGKIITTRDPDTGEEKPLKDSGPKLQAIQTALRIRESYRKLHGLDAEQKVSVAGSVRYEVVGVDHTDLA
ncbi:hypothetical protein OG235_27950 [Streptomyces sp. NBC_00024]|uniref:hypothetical protein n=1 Tax=Streptomyces sp. NBC_00024 TaxID=2903612 RepID=UPI0032481C6E